MHIKVLFFGALKDLMGKGEDAVSLPEGASVGDLLEHYGEQQPKLRKFSGSMAVSLNQEYAAADERLADGDEVGLLPPVSGGKDNEPRQAVDVRIVEHAINRDEELKDLARGEDGAVVVFEGVVRNHSRGRRTLFLEYETYETMALRQMEELAERALEQFAVREVAMVHRVGRLEIGETSVLIAVAAEHRGPAFKACQWLIDTLKRVVPIWKKEHFEDGAIWADGEPFPEEVGTPKPPERASN